MTSDNVVKLLMDEEGRAFERVIDAFERMIAEGDLSPGKRLVPERELAATLKVSRAALREALKALEILGLIQTNDRQGAVIKTPNAQSFVRFFRLMLSLRKSMAEELLELRIILECEAARLAARRASPDDHAAIRNALDEMATEVRTGGSGAAADIKFHEAVLASTQNESLTFVYGAIADLLKQGHHAVRTEMLRNPRTLSDLLHAHEEIYLSIREGDPEAAEDKMREHFTFTSAIYEQLERKRRILNGSDSLEQRVDQKSE